MAMDPNKSNNSSGENNPNRQLTPGASSRAARLSPPIDGGLSFLLHPMFHRLFEDMIRRSVREEFHKMSHYNLPPQLLPDPNIQARYQLQFINKVKDPTFTTKLVRDNNGDPIRVELYDSYTRLKVSADCFLSSAKVRITVLDAEFWKNKGVNWCRGEFIQSMLREREGKGAILTGPGLIIRLENGVGTFGDIVFTDNSRWTKSGFRLGVMVEVEGEEGYLNGERVQEGVGDHFQVRDRRGEASQKPDLLELKHEVQSLKKVGKDRASLLQKNNIKTVEDFLLWYYNKQPELRKILCIKSEADKGWKSMVEHAMQCADEFHAKYNALNNSSQPLQALVHTLRRTVPLQTNGGPRHVGSGSSVPNPCKNNLLIPDTSIPNVGLMQHMITGVLQVEVSDAELMDNLLANGELTPNNNSQFPSRSNSFDAGSCEALVQGFKASMPNLQAIYRQLPDICDIFSMNVLNEHISTASVEHIVETQHPLLHETSHANVERGNILNGETVQLTNGGGFPQLELSNGLIPMEDLYAADAESTPNYSMQFPSGLDNFDARPGVCFTGSMSNSVHVEPLTPRSNRKIKAILRSVAFLAVPRKRARIAPPANQTTVLAI